MSEETVKVKPAKSTKVKLVAAYGNFVDLITDQRFTNDPVEVEMHPWLQAQVDAKKLIVV